MILNPQAVLAELIKYQKIVNLCKTALSELSKQQVEDLRTTLKTKLDECEFTQVTGTTTSTIPLYSASAYIDKPDVLRQQITEAEAFIEKVISRIKDEVGPFYTKKEVMGFKEEGAEKTLGDHVWLPTLEEIKVKTYVNSSTGISTQVDWTHGQYRTAKDGQPFGQWKVFNQ